MKEIIKKKTGNYLHHFSVGVSFAIRSYSLNHLLWVLMNVYPFLLWCYWLDGISTFSILAITCLRRSVTIYTYPCAIIKNKNVVPLHNENTSHSPYASCVFHLSEFPQSILSMDDSIPSSSCESCQVIQFKFWLITSEVWQTVLVWTEKCISLTMYL